MLDSYKFFGVADGTRTHDNRNHNPGLYQLSYGHHCRNRYIEERCTPVRTITSEDRNYTQGFPILLAVERKKF